MTRLKKELKKRGIIWDENEIDIVLHGIEYDNCQNLVCFNKNVIVCVFHSAVLDSEYRIYDRNTLELLAIQSVYPETQFFGNKGNKWQVYTEF